LEAKASTVSEIVKNEEPKTKWPEVYVGCDTRESSPLLVAAVIKGIKAMRVPYTDFGVVTTPQLHYLVANHEKKLKADDYVRDFSNAFNEFCELSGPAKPGYEPSICLDCANGVGASTFAKFVPKVKHAFETNMINTDTNKKQILNYDCGAEYLQKDVRYPTNYSTHDSPAKCCSFDGDADRLIYFTKGNKFHDS